jgi:hypothetical protein
MLSFQPETHSHPLPKRGWECISPIKRNSFEIGPTIPKGGTKNAVFIVPMMGFGAEPQEKTSGAAN